MLLKGMGFLLMPLNTGKKENKFLSYHFTKKYIISVETEFCEVLIEISLVEIFTLMCL
jgi:hypothetical protein